MGHRGSIARGERGHGAKSFLILSRFGKRTVSPSMVSAATRTRAPKLLVRSPLTATRSKSRPNNASRDYLWIKKGTAFASREETRDGEQSGSFRRRQTRTFKCVRFAPTVQSLAPPFVCYSPATTQSSIYLPGCKGRKGRAREAERRAR